MNSAHKRFLKIIWKDIIDNMSCVILILVWTPIIILTLLISLRIISFKVMFWYLGIVGCIVLIKVLYMIITDIIIYLKNCWNKSKDYES